MSAKVARAEVTVHVSEGLHMRVASEMAACAGRFQSQVRVIKGELTVNGKGILDLLTLAAQHQDKLMLEAEGDDAEDAVLALSALNAFRASANAEAAPS